MFDVPLNENTPMVSVPVSLPELPDGLRYTGDYGKSEKGKAVLIYRNDKAFVVPDCNKTEYGFVVEVVPHWRPVKMCDLGSRVKARFRSFPEEPWKEGELAGTFVAPGGARWWIDQQGDQFEYCEVHTTEWPSQSDAEGNR